MQRGVPFLIFVTGLFLGWNAGVSLPKSIFPSANLVSANRSPLDYFGYTHNLTGLRTNVLRGDNTHAEYAFDGIGQLTNAIAYEPGGALRKNEDFHYAYDAAGNLQTRVNHTLTQSFGVDNANRLSSATRSGTLTVAGTVNSLAQTVTVNGQGTDFYTDRTFATTNGLSLSDGNNALTFAAKDGANNTTSYTENFSLPATVNYTYDLNGNLTSDGALGYDYDDADQLARITKTNAWKSEFTYDALGRRITRREYTYSPTSNSYLLAAETRYVWVGMSVLQERDAAKNVRVTYTGNLAREDATGTAFYFTDGNGNVSSLLDTTGNLKAKYRYDSFGNLISKSGPLADANLIRFSGKEYHPRSGLYYYGFRYYQPNLQRWMNEDPIGLAGGLNLYGFVGNDPVDGVDPYGLWFGEWLGGQVQQAAKGLYDLMMGEDRGGHYDQNTKGALDAQMGNVDIDRNDNVLRDVLGGLGQEMGQGAGDLAEAEAGAKLLGLGGRVVCKVASKLTKPVKGVIGALSETGAAAESPASKAASSGESVVADMANKASNCAKAAKETTSLLPARSPWPGNSGFIEGTVERKFLMPGETFDRYGFGGGKFVSPAGTSIEARALRPGTESLPFNTYQVVKPFEVNAGGVQPWFGQPGLGTQYELPASVNTLLNRGIIKPAP